MRWFQTPLLCLVEPILLVPFSPCVNILKMTILPLRLISPLWERMFSGDSFYELLALLPGDFIYPRQAIPSICMIAMQWHGLNYLNLFKILFELHVISFMAFLGVLFWSCYCHEFAWSSRTYILMIMWMPCCLWIISGLCYDYFHVGIWYYALEYYFGCHAAFGSLVASIIFIMMLVDIMFWSMMSEMMLACGS